MHKAKQKIKLNNFLIALISVLLFFAISEGALRLIKFRVNQTGGYFRFKCFQWSADKYKVPINRQDPILFWRCNDNNEFRGKKYAVSKKAGTFRIICLGDSTTQGYMLPPIETDFTETYPYYLEEILNQNNSLAHFEVINAGCGGYSSLQGLRYLKSELLSFDPDLVIFWFGQNDLIRAIGRRDALQQMPNKILLHIQSFLDKSKFYQFYKQLLFYSSSKLSKNGYRVSAEEFYANLNEMKIVSQSRGIKTLFITPVLRKDSQILSLDERGFGEYSKIFRDLKQANTAVFDVVDLFKSKKNGVKYFFDICHTNPEGNRLIAEAVYKTIVENKLLIKHKAYKH